MDLSSSNSFDDFVLIVENVGKDLKMKKASND